MNALRCTHCGGAIAVKPGLAGPRCLFCGSDALVASDIAGEAPGGWFEFRTGEDAAQGAWRDHVRRSWFRPNDLVHADLTLHRLLVPVWASSGRFELYWTGLERAMFEASGKRPTTGERVVDEGQVLVPASAALQQDELNGLGAFDVSAPSAWHDGATDLPHEVGEVSRSEAARRALRQVERREAVRLGEQGYQDVHVSAVPVHAEAELLLVPIWIGVATWKDVPYRVLVHGQERVVVAKLPISWAKVAAAVAAVMAVLLVIVRLL
ncbi:MAG: hypothetical protein H6733_12255 [Alphaproteobacteria bacterium]|nr:hypothetical protein [Alphaproteobacteria bacterium]